MICDPAAFTAELEKLAKVEPGICPNCRALALIDHLAALVVDGASSDVEVLLKGSALGAELGIRIGERLKQRRLQDAPPAAVELDDGRMAVPTTNKAGHA